MFHEIDEDAMLNPQIFHLLRREICGAGAGLENTPYGLRSVPTHTEDGIPIRKLYVANLPPKTTRAELFGVFAQYGFIKSCWLRMGEKGTNKITVPTYAFVTFSDPADAHKALLAPHHEKVLRGRNLRISPADSWHQPVDDVEPKSAKPRKEVLKLNKVKQNLEQETNLENDNDISSSSNYEDANQSLPEEKDGTEQPEDCESTKNDSTEDEFTILDVMNRDCLHHIFGYVGIRDLIRSERVSKSWQASVQEYLEGVRVYKTSWWAARGPALTTALLRRLLRRLRALQRLHIDHHWSALNDRTAHTVGKFCPMLEELKVVGMNTKNWNPLIYGCRNLKTVTFISCNKLTDSSLVHTVKQDSNIENMTIANNTHVTGLFLTGSNPQKLASLAFYNCYSLQGTVLSAALDTLPSLRSLKLDVCPVSMWKIVPLILKKLPKLEELSLSEYTSLELCLNVQANIDFCEAIAVMTALKVLNLSRNIYITDDVLKQVAQSCQQLESLNVSGCNSRKGYPHPLPAGVMTYPGVTDEGVAAVCAGCSSLRKLDVSYLRSLNDTGLANIARLPRLHTLISRGNPSLSAMPFATALLACHELQVIDACGCDNVSAEVAAAGVRALARRPRALTLRLGGTAAAQRDIAGDEQEYPTHKLLLLNVEEDRSNRHLRPDFVDHMFDDSSDASDPNGLDDDDYDDLIRYDEEFDDIFLDDDDEDYEAIYAYGINAPIILL